MKLAIFFGLLAVINLAFGATKSGNKMPETFVSACEQKFPTAEVIFNFRDVDVEEDYRESIKSLTASARKSNSIHSGARHVLGLTTYKLSWGLDASVESLQLRELDVACARPTIKIDLEVLYHKVHIAKEFARNSCEYNFVRDHEYKHVNINKDNMRRHSKELIAAFNKQFSNRIIYGSIAKVNKEVQTTMDKKWIPFVKKTTEKMEAESNKRHKVLDSPEEYAKGSTVCSGKISAILQGLERK
jgi:hypothetical protein